MNLNQLLDLISSIDRRASLWGGFSRVLYRMFDLETSMWLVAENRKGLSYRPIALQKCQLAAQLFRCLCTRLAPLYTVVQKNAPTLADYNYNPVQSILTIFSRLFVNDHKSCPVVKFSTSPHICCHYTLWHTMLYFALITLLIAKNAPTSDDHNFNKR